MSDISFDVTWRQLLLASPIIGWPGLVLGATIGALMWKRRQVAGALGAIADNLLWTAAAIALK